MGRLPGGVRLTDRLPAYPLREDRCAACPFSDTPEGIKVRDGFGPFFDAIVDGLVSRRAFFLCHKTTTATGGQPPEMLCPGAKAVQDKHGVKPRCRIVPRSP